MTVKLNPAPELLTFKQFPKVDNSPEPPFEAETGFGIGYSILKFTRKGNKVGVSLLVTVSFVEERSWVVRASQNEGLLRHERLHLMLAACGDYKMHRDGLAATYADEDDARAGLNALLTTTLNEVYAIGGQYDLDRELLFDLWQQASQRTGVAERALLQMATAAGSPKLIPLIVPTLDSDDPQLQELAVVALVAITGWDVRRDATGTRPWLDVVRDYKRECSAP